MVDAIVGLVWKPIKKELDTLQMLDDRYADTLSAIDEEIQDSESALEAMMRELVVEE
jgi:type I restriction enzyme M protein